MSYLEENSAGIASEFRYWAFISYSQHDAKWARWLHKKLEAYRVPNRWLGAQVSNRTIPRRLVPIFRDRDELPSAGDLSERIREALETSHALIVICSPFAASSQWVNEEVRTFKALGRSRWICPLIVDGEPNASDRPNSGLPECLPPALRFSVAADGTLTDERSDPLAADVRKGRDGWSNACLKLIAGILGIGFDDLRQREITRRRRQQLVAAVLSLAIISLLSAGYVATADADFDVPGSTEIRRQLDRYGATVFRRVPLPEDVARTLSESRKQLRTSIVDAIAQGKLASEPSIWSRAQVAAALYRDPDATNDEIRLVAPLLDQLFEGDIPMKMNGQPIGWGGDVAPRAETIFWVIMALKNSLRREGEHSDAIRTRRSQQLNIVQSMAEQYYPLADGGWNAVISEPPAVHSIYSSALAIHALLELQSAELCWRGDCNRLAVMIKDTSRWLIRSFVAEKAFMGWRLAGGDESAPNPELSLFVLGVLGRSPVPIPDMIRRVALQRLIELRLRPFHPAYQDFTYWSTYNNGQGQSESGFVRTRVIWYPWAIEALAHWLHRVEREHLGPEIKRALERSLGHVVIANADAMVSNTSHVPLFTTAETYYGLGKVR
jgi:MTH538 TIR-like domain (DUF1863)